MTTSTTADCKLNQDNTEVTLEQTATSMLDILCNRLNQQFEKDCINTKAWLESRKEARQIAELNGDDVDDLFGDDEILDAAEENPNLVSTVCASIDLSSDLPVFALIQNDYGVPLVNLKITRLNSLKLNKDTNSIHRQFQYYGRLYLKKSGTYYKPACSCPEHDPVHQVLISANSWISLADCVKQLIDKSKEAFYCKNCADLQTTRYEPNNDECNTCLFASIYHQDQEFKLCNICKENTHRYCTLPCGHSFHYKCVKEIKLALYRGSGFGQEMKRLCPNCRAPFELV